METYQDVFVTFLMGLGAILALVLTIAVSGVALAWSAKTRQTLNRIDSNPALLAFGQSATGQYLHQQLQGLLPMVDQPTDKAIQDMLSIPVLKKLYNQGIIDAPALSKGLSHFLGLTIDLLDGKPSQMAKDATNQSVSLTERYRFQQFPYPPMSPAGDFAGVIPPAPQMANQPNPDEIESSG